jgi:hypothetical protein
MEDDGRDAIRQMEDGIWWKDTTRQMEDGIWWEGHSKTDGRWKMMGGTQ